MSLTYLQILAKHTPTVTAALVELANLEAILTLPTPTVHVVSDIHGEAIKLRQVINNASGSMRPLFERSLSARLSPAELERLLTLMYYPRETWLELTRDADQARRRELLHWTLGHATVVLRALARRYTLKYIDRVVPDPLDGLFRELLLSEELARQPDFLARLLEPYVRLERDGELVRAVARVIRNLAVGELVVAGDLGDRGPRLDQVIEVIKQQPNVSITWGNHDASWMAACLGHGAAIATVVRLSLRYQRLSQLEDGYGISLEPVRRLAREVYGDDPATRFLPKGELASDALLLARMQKAAAILQFKLEGQAFDRRPEWGMTRRALLRYLDLAAGTVEIDGVQHPLLDGHLPTVDPRDPCALSPQEASCLAELTRAFVENRGLWAHMSFVVARGRMSVRRDLCAIFHGCVPVDERGEPLSFAIDGVSYRGKALFDAIEGVVQRAFRRGAALVSAADLDLLFYLWTGPRSPCFGKDRMTTFETYFVADPATHRETKNAYFKLLHDPQFCARVLADFGVDPHAGFIINGHVPVRLEAGEMPIKRSGRAITIDGAFAAAYGDKGFSLVLDAERIYLAQHHHFESAAAAVRSHADIVPTVSDVVVHAQPRTVGDTEVGAALRAEIAVLEELVHAYEANIVHERS